MDSIKIGDTFIGGDNSCFFIAEIGQNHQGDIEIAKQLIVEAKKIGVNCVKFQKSCLEEKFTKSALERSYNSINSFGHTYGDHKEFLEFTNEQFYELQDYSNSIGITFTASGMDTVSFDFLSEMNVPFIKIGSGDANNIPLLRRAAKQSIPLFISTGMQKIKMIEKVVDIMNGQQFVLMHCVSSYPTAPSDLSLKMIGKYSFSNVIVGYSGHETGILFSQAAFLLGAKVIERHFTFDKFAKGSDHSISLIPSEYYQLIKNVRSMERDLSPFNKITDSRTIIEILKEYNDIGCKTEIELGLALKEVGARDMLKCEKNCYDKLGKTLVFSRNLPKGHILEDKDVSVKVCEPHGIPADLYDSIIGQYLLVDVFGDTPIFKRYISL